MKARKNQIIIVEGKNDLQRIKEINRDLEVLITNGSAISDDFLNMVSKLSFDNEIVCLLDPDYSGELIRRKIMAAIPEARHIFLNKKDCISKNGKKTGVEHAPLPILEAALADIKIANYSENITINDLYTLGLAGDSYSKERRIKLAATLGIGYTNAKGFIKRLNLFNYKLEDIKELI